MIVSIGRGSDLEACGPLGEALADAAAAAHAAEEDDDDAAGGGGGGAPQERNGSGGVAIWRLLDINSSLWSQPSFFLTAAAGAGADAATAEAAEPAVQQES